MQVGQLFMHKKVLPFAFFFTTRPSNPSIAGKEFFLKQILLSDLRLWTLMSGNKQKYE